MKWLKCVKIRIVLVGVVTAIVLSGGGVNAEIIMSEPTNLGPVINMVIMYRSATFRMMGCSCTLQCGASLTDLAAATYT